MTQTPMDEMGSILQAAVKAVTGPRNEAYGPPHLNHGCTAALWRAYLQRRFGLVLDLDGRDVCLMNVLQKISRDAHCRQTDNLIDIAGYAENAVHCPDHLGSLLPDA